MHCLFSLFPFLRLEKFRNARKKEKEGGKIGLEMEKLDLEIDNMILLLLLYN